MKAIFEVVIDKGADGAPIGMVASNQSRFCAEFSTTVQHTLINPLMENKMTPKLLLCLVLALGGFSRAPIAVRPSLYRKREKVENRAWRTQ